MPFVVEKCCLYFVIFVLCECCYFIKIFEIWDFSWFSQKIIHFHFSKNGQIENTPIGLFLTKSALLDKWNLEFGISFINSLQYFLTFVKSLSLFRWVHVCLNFDKNSLYACLHTVELVSKVCHIWDFGFSLFYCFFYLFQWLLQSFSLFFNTIRLVFYPNIYNLIRFINTLLTNQHQFINGKF